MGTGENNFVGVGMGGGNPSYTITADADQDSPSAANITLQADGTPITPDSWALIRPRLLGLDSPLRIEHDTVWLG